MHIEVRSELAVRSAGRPDRVAEIREGPLSVKVSVPAGRVPDNIIRSAADLAAKYVNIFLRENTCQEQSANQ